MLDNAFVARDCSGDGALLAREDGCFFVYALLIQLELLEAVRDEVGPDMGIEYRISSWEYKPGSPEIKDVAAFLKEAQAYINLVNLSGGLICDFDELGILLDDRLRA